ncbi:MAG TPA: RNA polymerase sigma factor [Gammaproteobacteria bacterium]|nr:RNA polymerase sigma factor [Gammaproteobacteria bacterium]
MNDAALTVPAPPVDDPFVVEEAVLVAGAQRRNAQAFEALYRRHAGRIYASCLRLSGSAPVAEDCTQEAFVRAWESLPGFRGESAFGSWLHRIAINAALMRQRSGLRRARWMDNAGEDEIAAVAAPPETPDAALDLDRAIAVLPPGAREVFVLYDIEGYRHEEIAELTGLAVGTCKAHLHRARRLLQARLTQ